MVKQAALYGAIGGVLITLLKLIEYKHFVREVPSEIYVGLVAVIFTAVGIYLGLDSAGHPRFISSRKVANGPTMGDRGGASLLTGDGLYASAFREAKRL